MSDMGEWIELSVCQTCMVAVAGVLEIHDEQDQLSADALERWPGFAMWVDCYGDDCDSTHSHRCDCDDKDPDGEDPCEDGHHAGGFTWRSCDLCGQGGRDDIRVYADPVGPEAKQHMAAQTYVWGFGPYGWKAIQGAATYGVH